MKNTTKNLLRKIIKEEIQRTIANSNKRRKVSITNSKRRRINERYGYQDLEDEETGITEDQFIDMLDEIGWEGIDTRWLEPHRPSEVMQELDPIMYAEEFNTWEAEEADITSEDEDYDEEESEELFKDWFDEIGDWNYHIEEWLSNYDVSRVMNELDPTLYRQEFLNYADSQGDY